MLFSGHVKTSQTPSGFWDTFVQKLDERAGEAEFNKMTPHRALRYPFAILSDPSGSRGHAWLQSLLAGSR